MTGLLAWLTKKGRIGQVLLVLLAVASVVLFALWRSDRAKRFAAEAKNAVLVNRARRNDAWLVAKTAKAEALSQSQSERDGEIDAAVAVYAKRDKEIEDRFRERNKDAHADLGAWLDERFAADGNDK